MLFSSILSFYKVEFKLHCTPFIDKNRENHGQTLEDGLWFGHRRCCSPYSHALGRFKSGWWLLSFFFFFFAFGKFFWSAAFGKLKLLMVVLYEVSHFWFLLFPYLHQENCWPTWLQFGYYVPSLLKDLRIGGLCFPKKIQSQSFPSWVVEKTHGRHPGPFSGTPTFFKLLLLFFFFLVH